MRSPEHLAHVDPGAACRPPECLFSSLSDSSQRAFNQITHAVSYPEHAPIFNEGQIPRGIYLMCDGRAKLSTSSRDGNTFILRIATAGEVLGLHATVLGKPYEVSVVTMQPCQLQTVNREDFLPFLAKHEDACLQVAQHISRDYQHICDVVRVARLSQSISERLAKFLLDSSAEEQSADGVVSKQLELTHEDIAQLIGASRETITRTLSEFRRQEIVEFKDSTLTIRDQAALRKLVAPLLRIA